MEVVEQVLIFKGKVNHGCIRHNLTCLSNQQVINTTVFLIITNFLNLFQ